MKKNLTELVFILDRSGSMGGLEPDTIGGFNAMLTRQKEQEGEANVTTILFDHEVQLLHDRFPLKAVASLTEKDYYVRGCTALLDAIGYGVEKMVNIQRHLPEDERAEKVIFVLLYARLQSCFVFENGMIYPGFSSFVTLLVRIVDAPQKLQKFAAVLSVLSISPPHCGHLNTVTSYSTLSCASCSLLISYGLKLLLQ